MCKVVAIIPSRGGSKRIHRKNTKLLLGKPLIKYSIEQALFSKLIEKVYVSTEDQKYAFVSKEYGAEVILRPPELSNDATSNEAVIQHALSNLASKGIRPEYVVLLQPTSPLRYYEDIDNAIQLIMREHADHLLSVFDNDRYVWSHDKQSFKCDYKDSPRGQDKQWELIENGSIYISKIQLYSKENNRLGGNIVFYHQPPECSFQIDNQFDWDLMELLMKKFYIKNLYEDKLSKIKCFLMDVDGVLTDGGVYYGHDGEKMLKFNRQDGKGIELLRSCNYHIGVISAEMSDIVRQRLKKIGIENFHLGIKNKTEIFNNILSRHNYSSDEVLFIGDDIQDIGVLEQVGFSACPSNAVALVKEKSDYVCGRSGGNGALREVADLLLKNYQETK